MAELNQMSLKSDANLTAYWRFNGNSTDEKGYANGTDTSITYSTANGKYNIGAGFSGASKIVLGDKFDFSGAFSINVWVNLNNSTGVRMALLNKGGATGSDWQWNLERQVSDKCRAVLYQNNGLVHMEVPTTTSVNDLLWHMITVTYDGTTLTIYHNGLSENTSTTKTGSWLTNGADNANIGVRGDSNFYFTGKMDDVSIWSRVLTSGEILRLYLSSGSGFFNFL